MDNKINEIESKIDNWLYEKLDKSIPRDEFIYHCNLVYIDLSIDQKILFSPFEKHFLFSLNYNTHIAHRKLKETENFDMNFNNELYAQAFNMMQLGMEYSMLCDVFPLLHSKRASMEINGNDIKFDFKNIPRKHYKFITDNSIRKALSYTLQIACGNFQDDYDESIAMKLANLYMNFWNENMLYNDYEPYTRMDWGGINFFYIVASMRRFNKLYQENFDIIKVDSQKMMVVFSPDGVKKMRGYVPNEDDELYMMAFEDHIYKPIGESFFPKANISDAPLNRTNDGYIYVNPLVVLFNDSPETQFLNYLRRSDNKRYLRIKDKIKERNIPLIIEMIKYKFPNVTSVSNFYVKMPLNKKDRRECDLLLIDTNGIAIYIEIKHFYYPQSYCETKKVDSELTKALKKMPKQLDAIKCDWKTISETHKVTSDLKDLHGIVVSHRYMGFDVEINSDFPIVSSTALFENIAEATSLKEIYLSCKKIDEIYPAIGFVKRDFPIQFAGFTFHLEAEVLDPIFETNFNKSSCKQIHKYVISNDSKSYKNITDLAHAYIDSLK